MKYIINVSVRENMPFGSFESKNIFIESDLNYKALCEKLAEQLKGSFKEDKDNNSIDKCGVNI